MKGMRKIGGPTMTSEFKYFQAADCRNKQVNAILFGMKNLLLVIWAWCPRFRFLFVNPYN